MDSNGENLTEYLEEAKALVAFIESGDVDQANQSLDALTKLRESMLYQELGKLTRELHNTLNNLHVETKLSDLTESEIPDAKERLEYVIELTEDAANKTLGAVEKTLPSAEEMEERAKALKAQWDRFQSRDMQLDEFRGLTKEIDEFLTWSSENATHVRTGLSEVMMAQGFQDITGQIIRRVITMVQEVEDSLVSIIRLTGQPPVMEQSEDEKKEAEKRKATEAEGPQVPGLEKSEVVSSQDEVDDLLSSLGF